MRLKELRIKKNMKQQDVADFLECALSVYSRYEREERTCPLESIIKLSGLFEVSIECILDLPEPVAEGLGPEETELVRAFRQAEDYSREDALILLQRHQRTNTEAERQRVRGETAKDEQTEKPDL